MKNQYFGDINDYRKYGLIRALYAETRLRILVGWMLTPNDDRRDGGFRAYLQEPSRWRRFDPQLFDGLKALLEASEPKVSLIQNTSLLGPATYFQDLVPDDAEHRKQWTDRLLASAAQSDLVFLDPDNGLEVPSCPCGRKRSSKYVFWREFDQLWQDGRSLLVYQHFRRVAREVFIPRMVGEVRARTGAVVEAFRTSNVLFILASQAEHSPVIIPAISRVAAGWREQIVPAGFVLPKSACSRRRLVRQ